jgi:hypothetical protein
MIRKKFDLRLVPLAALLLLPAACERDEVKQYTVPKPPAREQVRLLAAIIPEGKGMWFFKLVGPVSQVSKHNTEFVDFVSSVRFTGNADNPVQWTVPEGWTKGSGAAIRFASFFVGPGGRPPEVTVFRFGQASSILDNVNRWYRLDLGLSPISEEQLKKIARPFNVGDNKIILVDATGPGAKKGRSGMGAGNPAGGSGGNDE